MGHQGSLRKCSRLGNNGRSAITNRYPLRKVLGQVDVTEQYVKKYGITYGTTHRFIHEKLECGHTQRPRSDMFGMTNSSKRRCRQCWNELTDEQRLVLIEQSKVNVEKREHRKWQFQTGLS